MYCNRHRLKRISEVMLLSSRAKPLTSLLCDAGAGILQTPFLLCQRKSPVGSTIRGARGRQGWRRNKGLILSCLPVCITQLLLHPSSDSSYMQFFQHLNNQSHHLPSELSAVSWSPLLRVLEPRPMGPTPAQETAALTAQHLLTRGLSFSNNSNHLLFSLAPEVVTSFQHLLCDTIIFLPFIFNLVNDLL